MNATIAAIATPPGRGGVGIVRVSGDHAKAICQRVIGFTPEPRIAHLAQFLNADKSVIDEGICLYFAAPKSFTGEDVVELQGHGGPIVLDMLLRRVLQVGAEWGARLARPGEFSERAFLNNKMDLVQVEAVAELINANSEQAAMAAIRSLQGDFSKAIYTLVEALTRLRMYVEAALDFPDEEIDFLNDARVQDALHNLANDLSVLQTQAKHGALLSEGVNAVIVGRPNAGKSTLLNSLTGQDTAIVTPVPGTTRDTVRARINIDGLLVNVVDTAGLRDTDDLVEQEGIKRALQAAETADLVLLVVDSVLGGLSHVEINNAYPELIAPLKPHVKLLVVYNKIDQLNTEPFLHNNQDHSVIGLSAHTGAGLDLLRQHIKQTVGFTHSAEGGIFLARRRHLDALARAQDYVLSGKQQLTVNAASELLAEELKYAQNALGEITGEFTPDDLLGRIFSEFCIGK